MALPLNDPVNPVVATIDPVTISPFVKSIDPVKYDAVAAVVANDEEIAFVAQLLVPTNVPVNDPLNEPVLICTELETTPDGSIVGAKDAEVANDAVVAIDDDTAQLLVPTNTPVNDPVNEPVLICSEEETTPVGSMVGAYDAVVANDEEIALVAQLPVPINIPVNDPLNEPVLICRELLTVPDGSIVGA